MSATDKWGRGPIDVSHDNAENPIAKVLSAYLEDRDRCPEDERSKVLAVSEAYRAEREREMAAARENDQMKSRAAAKSLFGSIVKPAAAAGEESASGASAGVGGGIGGLGGLLGGVKLKKTTTVVKTMFRAGEGSVTDKTGSGSSAAVDTDPRKALSKLIDFPGDLEEIKNHIADKDRINPAGKDAYGLTALHKFASWNKIDYLDLLLPVLAPADLEATCPEGKTALHYAVEMASVAAVKALVAAGVNLEAKDGKGRTVMEILESSPSSGVIERLKHALAKQ